MSFERWLLMTRRSFATVCRAMFMVAVFLQMPIPLVVTFVLGLKSSNEFKVVATFHFLICLFLTSVAYVKVF